MLGGVRFVPKDKLLGAADSSKNERQDSNSKRREAGLDWMTAPPIPSISVPETDPAPNPSEAVIEKPPNPRELNPFLKNGGEGYPSDNDGSDRRRPSDAGGGVGDGGASWRLKALKRAKERAARDGRSLEEVLMDLYGSLDLLLAGTVKVRAAHENAHLHAIRDRKRKAELMEESQPEEDSSRQGQDDGKNRDCREEPRSDRYRELRNDGSSRKDDGSGRQREDDGRQRERRDHGRYREPRDDGYRSRDRDSDKQRLKAPRLDDASFKWKNKRRAGDDRMRPEDAALVKSAAASYNKYENDGSFLQKFKEEQKRKGAEEQQKVEVAVRDENVMEKKPGSTGMDANQIAAKAMRLRLMGKTQEADELMKQAETARNAPPPPVDLSERSGNQTVLRTIAAKQKHGGERQEFDAVLAARIGQTRDGYRPDEEYDDLGTATGTDTRKRKAASRQADRDRKATTVQFNKLKTQQERCSFCFENPTRAKHLTVAIANYTYLMLPPTTPIVPGHCYIVPMQHEGSTRNVDDSVWEELRNFKKCLIKMFKQEDQDVIFMETVMGLAEQRRHCLLECVPVPSEVLGQAPLYFKKAIDEAEDEWSQHNAKKLIDTRIKGLRNSIPKNFPYFHVEFGLEGGYCHVIDDESSFNPLFGRNVLIGLLRLPQERMHQRAKSYGSVAQQKLAAQEFAQQWKPHDWTKMLD